MKGVTFGRKIVFTTRQFPIYFMFPSVKSSSSSSSLALAALGRCNFKKEGFGQPQQSEFFSVRRRVKRFLVMMLLTKHDY